MSDWNSDACSVLVLKKLKKERQKEKKKRKKKRRKDRKKKDKKKERKKEGKKKKKGEKKDKRKRAAEDLGDADRCSLLVSECYTLHTKRFRMHDDKN